MASHDYIASPKHRKGACALAFGFMLAVCMASLPADAVAAPLASSALAPTADDVPVVAIAIVLIIALLALLLAMRNRTRR